MDKIVKFLERYVQWLALGLGVVFLLYMAAIYLGYSYINKPPPLFVAIGGQQALPNDVDKIIVDKIVVPLERAVNQKEKPTVLSVDLTRTPPTITVSAGMDHGSTKQVTYNVTPSTKIEAAGKPTPLGELKPGALVKVEPLSKDPKTAAAIISETPGVKDVKAIYEDRLRETAIVGGPVDEDNASPAKLLGPIKLATASSHQPPGAGPVFNNPVAAPKVAGNLPIPPAAVPGPFVVGWTVLLSPGREDHYPISIKFRIDAAALAQQMNVFAQVPNIPLKLLAPEISRTYLLRQEMMPDGQWGPITVLDPSPAVKLAPYPGAGKETPDTKTWLEYRVWLENHQAELLKPKFFATASPWSMPVDPAPVAPAGTGTSPAGRPAGAVANPAAPPAVVSGGDNAANPPVTKSIEILAHDATMKEGHTYRYALRYRLFNALYEFDHQAVGANVWKTFDMPSEPALDGKNPADEKFWTPAITVDPTTQIFVTRINQINVQAHFTVYKWKDGAWSVANARPLQPGDAVNAGTIVSGWTLVDVRKDTHIVVGNAGDGSYVLVMDDHGSVVLRDVVSDAQNPMFLKLKGMAVPAGAGGAPAAAAAAR